MALVLNSIYHGFQTYFIDYKDPQNGDNFLIRSPWPTLAIIVTYLSFVKRWGPKFMLDRKPFELKWLIFWYNLAQVTVNIYILFGALKYSYLQDTFDYIGSNHNQLTNAREKLLSYENVYFWSRIFDLMDTVIFVLRKRDKQVTFLHVYHHTAVVFCEYLHNKFFAGSHYIMLVIVNSFVHIVMYLYYAVAIKQPGLKVLGWCKQRITDLQMVQFTVLIIHFTWPILTPNGCSLPKIACLIAVMQNLFMVVLFSDFYKRTYSAKPVMLNVAEDKSKSKNNNGPDEKYLEKLENDLMT